MMEAFSNGGRRPSALIRNPDDMKKVQTVDTYEDMSSAKAPRVQKALFAAQNGAVIAGTSTAWTKSFKINTQVSFMWYSCMFFKKPEDQTQET